MITLLKKMWRFFRPELEVIEFKIPEFSFKFRGAKNRWHHYVCTVSWWQKDLPKKKEKLADVAVWTDGKLKVRTIIDECGNQFVEKKRA